MYQEIKKYHKTKNNSYNGKVYDSCKEAGEARELDKKIDNGEIVSYQKQVRIDFYIKYRQTDDFKPLPPIIIANPEPNERRYSHYFTSYILDYAVTHNDGTIEFVEVKGLKGDEFKKKWLLLDAVYGNNPNYLLKIIK